MHGVSTSACPEWEVVYQQSSSYKAAGAGQLCALLDCSTCWHACCLVGLCCGCLRVQVDLTFSSCPLLQPLPRYVYALLRSPLLSSAAQYHSDLAAYLHHLWCALPPHELAKAVYCRLTAFADPDRMIATGLPLSRHSLQGPVLAEAAAAAARGAVAAAKKGVTAAAADDDAPPADSAAAAACDEAGGAAAGQHDGRVDPAAAAAAQSALSLSAAVAEGRESANILLLDAFILVLVLYRASAPAELPFPPPQDSLLWRTITEIKTVRVCLRLPTQNTVSACCPVVTLLCWCDGGRTSKHAVCCARGFLHCRATASTYTAAACHLLRSIVPVSLSAAVRPCRNRSAV